MSEGYVTTQSTTSPHAEAMQDTPQAGVRFTPLRSAIVVRDYSGQTGTEEIRSPLVPVRRRST